VARSYPLKKVGLIILLALCAGGCRGEATRATTHPKMEGRVFTVSVSEDAASAARRDGVDLHRLVARSAEKVLALLPHRGRVRIAVSADASRTIPGIGVGSSANPRTGNVSIRIDPDPPAGLRKTLETWIPGFVAHELHHSSRIRTGPGYGVTLGQALVSEGLADHFASEVFPDTPSRPCDHALTRAQERSLWLVARRVLNIPFGYDHWEWFFGAGTIPRWAGYTLGYEIVGQYLSHRRTAADAVHVDAAKVIAPFHGF
jgi:hypothetical protein